MRKITLAAAAGAVAVLFAAAPAFAYTTYQIQTAETAAALNENAASDQQQQDGGLHISSSTTNVSDQATPFGTPYGAPMTRPTQQQNLSGDMGWQGTGYYLRPNN